MSRARPRSRLLHKSLQQHRQQQQVVRQRHGHHETRQQAEQHAGHKVGERQQGKAQDDDQRDVEHAEADAQVRFSDGARSIVRDSTARLSPPGEGHSQAAPLANSSIG